MSFFFLQASAHFREDPWLPEGRVRGVPWGRHVQRGGTPVGRPRDLLHCQSTQTCKSLLNLPFSFLQLQDCWVKIINLALSVFAAFVIAVAGFLKIFQETEIVSLKGFCQ